MQAAFVQIKHCTKILPNRAINQENMEMAWRTDALENFGKFKKMIFFKFTIKFSIKI